MNKQRPDVDEHSWDLAVWFLTCEDGFQPLREDIQIDLQWELAEVIQKAVEGWFSFQFPRRKQELSSR